MLKKIKFDHITPILQTLHWLPVHERINYKIATLCFKHFNNTLPSYLSSLLILPPKVRQLRSAKDETRLVLPIKSLKSYGERSFEYCGPLVWNNIPQEIRTVPDINYFKRALKHHLFSRYFYQ